jgi:hypothetical protein
MSMILYTACLGVGAAFFSHAGEAIAGGSEQSDLRPAMAARAAEQLQSFNDRLVRVLNA